MLTTTPLQLKQVGQTVRYHVRTTTAVQVGQMKFANELLYVVEQTLKAQSAAGYVVQFDVHHTMQQAEDLFSQVVADVNQVSRTLLVQTDPHGNLLQVENQLDLLKEWQHMGPALRDKYAQQAAVRPFLDAFEQQLRQPGSLEANLRHKGLYGALLPGIYGYDYQAGPALSQRCISGFFNTFDLPLLLSTEQTDLEAEEAVASPRAIRLLTTGKLDEEAFAEKEFRRLIRSLVDDYRFSVELEVTYKAIHLVDEWSGLLLTSQQALKAEVPGVYHNAITHHVSQQPTQA